MFFESSITDLQCHSIVVQSVGNRKKRQPALQRQNCLIMILGYVKSHYFI